jgi:hypothetical protein
MKHPPLILSIDWDFFIKEDPKLDMGHREIPIFLETMWAIRLAGWMATREAESIEDVTPFTGPSPERFVMKLGTTFGYKHLLFGNALVGCAESHAALPQLLDKLGLKDGDKCDVVNIDAHHDCGYGDNLDNAEFKDKFDCGSWVPHLHARGMLNSMTQCYPDWRFKHPECSRETHKNIKERLPVTFQFLSRMKPRAFNRPIAAIFLCRSGCWSPPCYDDKFNVLCGMFGNTGIPARNLDMDEVNKLAKMEAEQMKEIKEHNAKLQAQP